MEENKTGAIIIALLIVLLAIITISYKIDRDKYNNGICRNCGGTLIYQQAIGHKYSTSYMFKCNKCHKMYEFDKDAIEGAVIHYEDETSTDMTPTDAIKENN